MIKTQLEASTFGIGQLITQRKIFIVPEHQRNYSWGLEQVEQFLADVIDALGREAQDYFIGLIVLKGTDKGSWEILDGQQRLATTTMIYGAIREWLYARGFDTDAKQVESEYIGVRHLGGHFSPRLRLNTENRAIFESHIVGRVHKSELQNSINEHPRRSSNRNLLRAALFARDWVEEYCNSLSLDRSEQAHGLFKLSNYLDSGVKLVCLDVSSTTDAFVLFESLNDRGADLSALDLVKNFIFSFTDESNISGFRSQWEKIVDNIQGKDADDFLKVFWTSRFGIVQKLDLFKRIRDVYKDASGAGELVHELADAAEKLEAIDDAEHRYWQQYGPVVRDRLVQLATLGSRQVRPVILSALSRFSHEEFKLLLWALVVLIVRYQLIGRERTGILEKTLGRLCQGIWSGKITNSSEAYSLMGEILPDDSTFFQKFQTHIEPKAARVAYLLAMLEVTEVSQVGNESLPSEYGWRALAQSASPDYIILPDEQDLDNRDLYFKLGNCVLLEDTLSLMLSKISPDRRQEILLNSDIQLTAMNGIELGAEEITIQVRGEYLAGLAVDTWKFNNSMNYVAGG